MNNKFENPIKNPEAMEWNEKVKLIISDVDETIADLYVEALPEMIAELEKVLSEEKVFFLISGQSIKSIQWRIVDHIRKDLRKRIIVGHCSGAEVWGFDEDGNLRDSPFYSLYETALSESQKQSWRDIISELVKEFKLKTLPTMPIAEFEKKTGGDPQSAMLEDRGPQITFEIVNGYDLSSEQAQKLEVEVPQTHGQYDLRIPILERAEQLLAEKGLPITPRLAGVFAIDFALKGVSKTTAVRYVIEHDLILSSLGIRKSDIENPESMEVWGDKFSVVRGGTDRHISEALPKEVRSITFREERPEEFLEGYNTVVWGGKKHLHDGLLEFLKSRN
jgi:hydroxymethylpyrimidine pyrophosphatase-like HAD family hydrolase